MVFLRYEWAADEAFEDRASTFVVRRNLPVPKSEVTDTPLKLEITTQRLRLTNDKKPCSQNELSVKARGICHATIVFVGMTIKPMVWEVQPELSMNLTAAAMSGRMRSHGPALQSSMTLPVCCCRKTVR